MSNKKQIEARHVAITTDYRDGNYEDMFLDISKAIAENADKYATLIDDKSAGCEIRVIIEPASTITIDFLSKNYVKLGGNK